MKSRLLLIAFVSMISTAGLFADMKKDVEAARRQYEQLATHDEPARLAYMGKLADILAEAVANKMSTGHDRSSDGFDLLYSEMRKHPVPAGSDSHQLTALRAGKWESPRHDYLYRANGTWSMLPLEDGATSGRWRIEGNRYFDGDPKADEQYTIIFASKKYFIFAASDAVFFEKRLTK